MTRANGTTSDWSEGENDTLITGWRGGITSNMLARSLGRTRCAVLGRVHRLQKLGVLEARSSRTPDRAVALPASVKSKPLPVVKVVDAAPLNITLADLDPKIHCRWPFDTKKGGYVYCGHTPEHGKAYCTEHLKQARPK